MPGLGRKTECTNGQPRPGPGRKIGRQLGCKAGYVGKKPVFQALPADAARYRARPGKSSFCRAPDRLVQPCQRISRGHAFETESENDEGIAHLKPVKKFILVLRRKDAPFCCALKISLKEHPKLDT